MDEGRPVAPHFREPGVTDPSAFLVDGRYVFPFHGVIAWSIELVWSDGKQRSCYVEWWRAPENIHQALRHVNPMPPDVFAQTYADKQLRIGALNAGTPVRNIPTTSADSVTAASAVVRSSCAKPAPAASLPA